jgi:hypothetical protein
MERRAWKLKEGYFWQPGGKGLLNSIRVENSVGNING